MKIINGIYKIYDCEHEGDIEREKNFLLSHFSSKITIKKVFWDKKDCGEAYIEFSFQDKYFIEIYNNIQAEYDTDINNYLDFSKYSYNNIPIISRVDFLKKRYNFRYLFDSKYITFHLFFSINKNTEIKNVINEAINSLGKKTTIEAYSVNQLDTKTFIDVLFKTSIKTINFKKVYEFGDFCLGGNNESYLRKNHIYGSLTLNSILKGGLSYDKFKELYNKIYNKEPILYTNKDYYCKKIIEVNYNDYMINNIIQERISKDNKVYYIYNE